MIRGNLSRNELSCISIPGKYYLPILYTLSPLLLLEEAALEDFEGVGTDSEAKNAVVIGLAPSQFKYEVLNKAFRYFKY